MIGRWVRRRGDDPESGAYAILYAVLLLVFIGLTAIVVDLGGLQHDRRADRLLTDSAAIAGATALGDQPPDARAGCLSAWNFIRANLGAGAGTGVTNCASTFPRTTDRGFVSCPATARTAAGTLTVGAVTYTVSITWPVPDSSALMTQPDVRPRASTLGQPVVEQDGNACERIAVAIGHERQFVFANAIGFNNSATVDHSVALTSVSNGPGTEAAPLVILDPHACSTLTAEGGGGVLVGADNVSDPNVPGVVAVDSDGRNCSGGSTVIDSNAASSIMCTPLNYSEGHCPSAIWAQDSDDRQRAQINVFALNSGSPSPAYKPAEVTCTTSALPAGPTGALCPRPNTLLQRVGRSFVDAVYDCTEVSSCDAAGPNAGVSQLEQFVTNSFTMGGDCTADSFPASFTCISRNATCTYVSGVKTCTPQSRQCSQAAATVYAGNMFVDCTSSDFTVSGVTGFTGLAGTGTVVFAGNVTVTGSGACLFFNSASGMCSSPTLAEMPSDGPVVYVAGTLSTKSGGSLVAPQTFVLLGNCSRDGAACSTSTPSLNLQNNTAGAILWSAPMGALLASPTTCVPGGGGSAPTTACFGKLALWGELATPTSSPDRVFGQAGLFLRGSFFTPNAQFNLSGGSSADIRDAQFITARLDVNGGGLLTMIPNIKYTNPPPILAAQLIR